MTVNETERLTRYIRLLIELKEKDVYVDDKLEEATDKLHELMGFKETSPESVHEITVNHLTPEVVEEFKKGWSFSNLVRKG